MARSGKTGETDDTETERLLMCIEKKEHWVIFVHDNPDPDAFVSALCFKKLVESAGKKATIAGRGEIGFEENALLLEHLKKEGLEIEMHPPGWTATEQSVDEETGTKTGACGKALLDTGTPGVYNPLPAGTKVDVVIDHHPMRAAQIAEPCFYEVRPEKSSTSLILYEHMVSAGMRIGKEITSLMAAGIYYATMVDTHNFRTLHEEDSHPLSEIFRAADKRVLSELQSPPLDVDTLDILGRAIQNREITGGVSFSCVDYVTRRDPLARAAEFLLRQKSVHTSVVVGIVGDRVCVTSRTTDPSIDLGDVMIRAFGEIGVAGGHAHSGGAEIPLSLLSYAVGEDERRGVVAIVKRAVRDRFFETAGFLDDERISRRDE